MAYCSCDYYYFSYYFFFFPSRDFIFQPIPTLVFDFNVLDLIFLNISIYRFFLMR